MCMPNIPSPIIDGFVAMELGYRPARALVKAGEALLDKVVDFDGDKSTLSDAKRELKRFTNEVQFLTSSQAPLKDKLLTAAMAPILAPIGALAAPIMHPMVD